MNIALLLSGGVGTRMNLDIPKQYVVVNEKMIITYSLRTLLTSPTIDEVWIVAEESYRDAIIKELIAHNIELSKFKKFVCPGASRQSSIYNGLHEIVNDINDEPKTSDVKSDDYVLIHDAARPLLSEEQISKCFTLVKGHDGAMPVLRMKDTIYYSEDGRKLDKLLERNNLYAGQAPEVFHLMKYYNANIDLLPERIHKVNGSTEAAILSGMDVIMITGDENNFKVTTKEDLERLQWLIAERG